MCFSLFTEIFKDFFFVLLAALFIPLYQVELQWLYEIEAKPMLSRQFLYLATKLDKVETFLASSHRSWHYAELGIALN